MRFLRGNLLMLGISGILLIGILLNILAAFVYTKSAATASLTGYERLASVAGWSIQRMALGETEFITSQAEGMLNLSDYVRYSYQKGDTVIDVYLAYWAPGKASYRSVMRHTPDRCWPNSGWIVDYTEQQYVFSSTGVEILPCQYRRFKAKNTERWVAYWYLMDDLLVEIRPDDPRPLWETRLPLRLEWLAQRRRQYFLRISANRPLEEVFSQPIGRELADILAPLISMRKG